VRRELSGVGVDGTGHYGDVEDVVVEGSDFFGCESGGRMGGVLGWRGGLAMEGRRERPKRTRRAWYRISSTIQSVEQ
jgi:hypothetical protein